MQSINHSITQLEATGRNMHMYASDYGFPGVGIANRKMNQTNTRTLNQTQQMVRADLQQHGAKERARLQEKLINKRLKKTS
jgi:hypothetical protein